MADRADRPAFEDVLRTVVAAGPEADAARIGFAAARMRALEAIELRLLELAVSTPRDEEARWLELWADAAWRDAQALQEEHEPEGGSQRS
jgi:hypothetical protein